MREFTVILPTRNRAAVAAELVRYLRSSLSWRCPIVLVDQSEDGGRQLAALLPSEPPDHLLHVIQEGLGTCRARNEGARRALTPWLLFLDDDVRPAAEYLPELERFLDGHPWLDAVAGAIGYAQDWESYLRDPSAWWQARRQRPPSRGLPEAGNAAEWFLRSAYATHETLTLGLGSGNMVITSKAFFACGGFDEQIDHIGDDREIGLRLWWYGYRVVHAPDVVVFHLQHAAGGSRETRRPVHNFLEPGWLYVCGKWFGPKIQRGLILSDLLRVARESLWRFPVRLYRACRSLAEARRRLAQGPIYVGPHPPTPKAILDLPAGASPEQRSRCPDRLDEHHP